MFTGGTNLSGVITTADRSGSVMLEVVGHMDLDLYSLDGSLWGVPKGTNMNTGQQAEEAKKLSLYHVFCYY